MHYVENPLLMGIDDYGVFRPRKFFIATHNKFPCIHEVVIPKEYEPVFDLVALDPAMIIEAFPESQYSYRSTVFSKSFDDKDDDILSEIYGPQASSFTFYNKDFICEIDKTSISLYYEDSLDYQAVIDELLDILPREEEKKHTSKLSLICFEEGSYFTTEAPVEVRHSNIEENYNDDFIEVDQRIREFLDKKGSGLVLLSGVAGSGKTSVINTWINELDHRFVYVPSTIAANLASPDLISFLLDHKDSIFILEDCENVVMSRESGENFANAISTILNMTDGLMSGIFNCKFICTFNTNIDNVDPALLRKGRCVANYVFEELSLDKTNALLKKLGYPESDKKMTLAEIYNYDQPDNNEPSKEIIGY